VQKTEWNSRMAIQLFLWLGSLLLAHFLEMHNFLHGCHWHVDSMQESVLPTMIPPFLLIVESSGIKMPTICIVHWRQECEERSKYPRWHTGAGSGRHCANDEEVKGLNKAWVAGKVPIIVQVKDHKHVKNIMNKTNLAPIPCLGC